MTESMYINNRNVDYVRKMIQRKEGTCVPWYPTVCDSEKVITDMDHFPYGRFFRGRYDSSDPIVLEREAGFRPRRDSCYRTKPCQACDFTENPSHCFEVACSTVFPCNPKDIVHSPLIHELAPYKTCINLYR